MYRFVIFILLFLVGCGEYKEPDYRLKADDVIYIHTSLTNNEAGFAKNAIQELRMVTGGTFNPSIATTTDSRSFVGDDARWVIKMGILPKPGHATSFSIILDRQRIQVQADYDGCLYEEAFKNVTLHELVHSVGVWDHEENTFMYSNICTDIDQITTDKVCAQLGC